MGAKSLVSRQLGEPKRIRTVCLATERLTAGTKRLSHIIGRVHLVLLIQIHTSLPGEYETAVYSLTGTYNSFKLAGLQAGKQVRDSLGGR